MTGSERRSESDGGLQMTLHQVGVGADRAWMRALGHGRLSSVDVLRAVMAQIAETTGDEDYNNLIDDALRAEFARGIKGTIDLIRDNRTRSAADVGAIQAMASTIGEEDPGYIAAAYEVARRTTAYQGLATRELWVTVAADMERTVGGTD